MEQLIITKLRILTTSILVGDLTYDLILKSVTLISGKNDLLEVKITLRNDGKID